MLQQMDRRAVITPSISPARSAEPQSGTSRSRGTSAVSPVCEVSLMATNSQVGGGRRCPRCQERVPESRWPHHLGGVDCGEADSCPFCGERVDDLPAHIWNECLDPPGGDRLDGE